MPQFGGEVSGGSARTPLWGTGGSQRLAMVAVWIIATVFLLRVSPLLTDQDDYLRYYFGGWVGWQTLSGHRQDLADELRRAYDRLDDDVQRSRLRAAATTYSPLVVLRVGIAEPLRRFFGVPLVSWALVVPTIEWLVVLIVAARWATRQRLSLSPAWFIGSGIALGWLHLHTYPFLPAPRGFSVLAAGLALAALLAGGNRLTIRALLVLGAVAHPYQQLINLAVVGAAAMVLLPASERRAQRRTLAGHGAVAVVALIACFALALLFNLESSLGVTRLRGVSSMQTPFSVWLGNQWAAYRLVVILGIPLVTVAYWYQRRQAFHIGVLYAVSIIVPAFVVSGNYYAGEYLSRIGGAWQAVLLVYLLRLGSRPPPYLSRLQQSALTLLVLMLMAAGLDNIGCAINPTCEIRPLYEMGTFVIGPVEQEVIRLMPP
ncbi:MAG: hypothetical protein G01um101431_260 [Parcubacteria group bacterium Gr01-1014_31]|nr:MAG: hypothetical protein G01um101431_260 [Parcubacteria group bacterium Gr01-1014_31]